VVVKGVPVVTRASSGLWELLVIRLSIAAPLRRPHFVAAIPGQKGGHAVLDAKICASLFLLERIFYSGKVVLKPPRPAKWFRSQLGLGWRHLAIASSRRRQTRLCGSNLS
jgi:hypothetical protein